MSQEGLRHIAQVETDERARRSPKCRWADVCHHHPLWGGPWMRIRLSWSVPGCPEEAPLPLHCRLLWWHHTASETDAVLTEPRLVSVLCNERTAAVSAYVCLKGAAKCSYGANAGWLRGSCSCEKSGWPWKDHCVSLIQLHWDTRSLHPVIAIDVAVWKVAQWAKKMLAAGSCWDGAEPAEPPKEKVLQQPYASGSEHPTASDEAEAQLCPRMCAFSPCLLPQLLPAVKWWCFGGVVQTAHLVLWDKRGEAETCEASFSASWSSMP